MTKTTLELVEGDQVRLPNRVVRTVSEVTRSPYVTVKDRPIFYVNYSEGRTAEWSAGNSATAATVWSLV